MKRLFGRILTWVTLPSVLLSGSASAFSIDCDCEDFTGSFDTTISFGVGWRVSDPDKSNIGVGNGGTYPTMNEDDGNLNYSQWDVYQALFKTNHELDLRLCNWGVFVRFQALYDVDVIHGNTERTPLSRRAKHILGEDIRLLDFFVTLDTYGFFPSCCKPMTLYFGQQVLNWGESVFIPNGLNVISPFDISKLRTAGAQLRDALLPIPMFRIDIELCENLTLGAWWQFWWKETLIDPKGSFFSTNDFISPGAAWAMIAAGGVGTDTDSCTQLACAGGGLLGQSAARGPDEDGSNTGNYGVFLTYFAEELNDTEFGLYFAWYASRLPLVSAYRGTSVGPAGYLTNSFYFVTYPDDIKVIGASFNTMVGTVAVQGEYSFHWDQPIQIDDALLLQAALAGAAGIPPATAIPPATLVLGPYGDNTRIEGWRRKCYSQAQIAFTKNMGTSMMADQTIILAEFGMTRIHNLESHSLMLYEAPGTPWGKGYGENFAAGYRVLVRSEYNSFWCDTNFIPQLAFSHDLFGTLPTPLTHFVKDRMSITASLLARYQTYAASIGYTNFFGGGVFNQLRDRDFLTLSVSNSF